MEILEKQILTLEKKLLKTEIRKSSQEIEEILCDDFLEFTSSGSEYVYKKGDEFEKEDCTEELNWEIKDFRIKKLSEDCVMALYKLIKNNRCDNEKKYSFRSSIWKNVNNKWKLYFHQGTIVPQKEEIDNIEYINITEKNRKEINKFIIDHWNSTKMVVRGKEYDMSCAYGIAAVNGREIIGLITYKVDKNVCEIISLDSLIENQGIGSMLLNKLIDKMNMEKCRKIVLITTNDNINAIKFYQKRGFDMVNFFYNAVETARSIKKSIPFNGDYNIPIRHEIEFERQLNDR